VDINTLRSVVTVLAFVSFVGIVIWAYSGRARRGFEEAAQLPFAEDGGTPDLPGEDRR
jgi:cytochrome c oxidase cbb3-type subunit 4